jgi:hypothetical protein
MPMREKWQEYLHLEHLKPRYFRITHPSIVRLKAVRPVLNVVKQETSCHSKFYHEQQQQLNPEWRWFKAN